MPTLTIDLTEEEMRKLKEVEQARKLTPVQFVTLMVRRDLSKRGLGYLEKRRREEKIAEKAGRQLALAEYIRAHGMPTGQVEKRDLAERFGKSERTIYRDLKVAEAALRQRGLLEAPAAEPAGERAAG
jgi:hypothetical protein